MKPSSRVDTIKAIRNVWESLESHLDLAIDAGKHKKIVGDEKFHIKAIKEYAQVLQVLSSKL